MKTRRISLDVLPEAFDRIKLLNERHSALTRRPQSLRDTVTSALGLLQLVLDTVEAGGEVVVRKDGKEKQLTFI